MGLSSIRRRQLALGAASLPLASLSMAVRADSGGRQQTYVNALKQGGSVVLIRHAITESGVGDPPGMRLGDCSTQRNLSEEGRAQARRIGKWFASHGLAPSRIRSSQWCRCLDTAAIAFSGEGIGKTLSVEPWTALNSFFQGQGDRNRQLQEAIQSAASLAMRKSDPPSFEVWVTHHVVIGALTHHYPASGEMVVVRFHENGKPLTVVASGLIF